MLFFSSCASYQYLTLDSSQLGKNDRKEFNWENDTMRISYNFTGQNGPMHVNIYNKTQQPLYVNWKKSALIRDQHSLSFYNSIIQASGTFSGNSYAVVLRGTRSSGGDFNASINLPEGTDFIAPGSGIDKDLPAIAQSGNLLEPIPDSVQSIKIADEYGNPVGKIKKVTFTETESPVQFRSYMTFSLGPSPMNEFSVSHSFYVQEIVQTPIEPANFIEYRSQGDQLFVKH
jgi:hypothetical protein